MRKPAKLALVGLLVAIGASPLGAQEPPTDPDAALELQRMRAVIQELNSTLIDPGSAHINLPYGFTPMTRWRVWGVEMTGFFTCGVVNSRNRMGGYVGKTAFLAHISPQGQVSVTMDNPSTAGQRYGGLMISRLCGEKLQQGQLPSPHPQTVAAFAPIPTSSSERGTMAKQLEDLAKLHAQGILSDEEFASAKQKVLQNN
jgi:hypothetical protein